MSTRISKTSKLSNNRVTKRVSVSVGKDEYDNRRPPTGAKIISKNTEVTAEEIENGWLISKRTSGDYKDKEGTRYYSYCDKTFSKEEPFLDIGDKNLADLL